MVIREPRGGTQLVSQGKTHPLAAVEPGWDREDNCWPLHHLRRHQCVGTEDRPLPAAEPETPAQTHRPLMGWVEGQATMGLGLWEKR